MSNIKLTLQDTNILKGVAIILMIIHHLDAGSYDDICLIHNHGLISDFSKVSKVCVAIYVFLSGYGLMAQTQKKGSLSSISGFYFHRFKKLYFNYWFIWLFFVPISYYCFGMTFEKVYHTCNIWHPLTDLLGLHSFFFIETNFNPVWWFYSCIILLYFLYPLLYVIKKYDPLFLILFSFTITFLPISIPYVDLIRCYIVAFCLGMLFVPSDELCLLHELHDFRRCIMMGGAFLSLLLFVIYRFSNDYPFLIDVLITITLVRIYTYWKMPETTKYVMGFLGKHSMNIFLIHTFIADFWFKNFVYASRNPFIAFIIIFAICIPLSMCLEYIKKYTIYRII